MVSIRPLPADLQKIAIAELNEVPDRLPADIEALREWIKQQPHLRSRTDDQFLVSFLRGCKFSLERAKSKLDRFYSLKTKYPEFFTLPHVEDPKILELIKLGIGLHLPTPLNENGPRILLVRGGGYPLSKFSFMDVMRLANGLQILNILEDDYANVNGVITLLDMSDLTAGHMLQMTPTVAKKMSTFAEEAMPIRQKGSHFIHTPFGFDRLFNAVKPFMPVKQQERVHMHGTLESLYQHIPLKYLPKEYGGENGSVQEIIDHAVKMYTEKADILRDELKYGVDEKLRPGKAIDYDSVFGVDGSFRSLNVD